MELILMKVVCYRKRLINKIKFFLKKLFGRDRHARSLIYHQECRGTTLPPFAGFRLDVASKIVGISKKRDWYGR